MRVIEKCMLEKGRERESACVRVIIGLTCVVVVETVEISKLTLFSAL